jgi:pSer/pThr/pTyr-binding forkhead associated (FHA) protein
VRWLDANGSGAAIFREAFFIGRGTECGVRFYDPLVSRKHARVYPEAGIWMIEDLGSRNGTLLDEKRISAPAALVFETGLRVNEAGPLLRLEHVAAGPAYRSALMQFRDGPSVAHVRAPARDLEPPPRSGPLRT